MIKLLASDLDGTLLGIDHEVTPVVKDAITRLRASGVHFVPASGRDYRSLQLAIKDLEITPKCVCLNGAESFDNEGNIVESIPLKNETVKELKEVLLRHVDILDIEFISNKKRYCNANESNREVLKEKFSQFVFFRDEEDGKNEMIDYFFSLMEFEEDLDAILKQGVQKVEARLKSQEQRDEIWKDIAKIDGIDITAATLTNIEVTDKNATKGNMVAKVAKHYGYDEDEVAVVGDGLNDVSMLKRFKYSYAMGQAPEAVKKAAHFITKSNEEDGVAYLVDLIIEMNAKEKDLK